MLNFKCSVRFLFQNEGCVYRVLSITEHITFFNVDISFKPMIFPSPLKKIRTKQAKKNFKDGIIKIKNFAIPIIKSS